MIALKRLDGFVSFMKTNIKYVLILIVALIVTGLIFALMFFLVMGINLFDLFAGTPAPGSSGEKRPTNIAAATMIPPDRQLFCDIHISYDQ